MTLSAVASRYANALAEVVTSPSSTLAPQQALAELRAFEAVLGESHELRQSLLTPAVPVGRKRAVIGRIGERLGISPITRNFLFVLVDHRRIASLAAIVQDFEVVLDQRLGYVRAEVSSAAPLDAEQEAALSLELAQVTGKRIRMGLKVDPSLIGGAVARIGSTVYDGSVRGQLAALERLLGEAGAG